MTNAEKYLTNLFDKCSHKLNLRNFNQFQDDSVLPILNGESVLLSAPTGCGKTEAVIVPLLEKIIASDKNNGKVKTRILYICPTKALINDLYKRFKWTKEHLGIKLAIKTGDIDDTINGEVPQLIFTTPESLDVMLSTYIDEKSDRYLRNQKCLKSIKTIVIDEIHQFVVNIRGEHLKWLLFRLMQLTAKHLQIIGMSATIPEREKVEKYIKQFGLNPKVISTSSQKKETYLALRTINNRKELYDYIQKLKKNINAHKILIFAETRLECDIIYENLMKIEPELNCFVHYSTIGQNERERIENEYKFSSQDSICIATSTLELGIDIGDIDAVILYGAPGNISSFIQKIGRGNRRKDIIFALGIIKNFDDDFINNDLVKFMGLFNLFYNNKFENITNNLYYSVIIQQIFSYSKSRGFFLLDEFSELLSKLNFNKNDIDEIIRNLENNKLISKPLFYNNKFAIAEQILKKISLGEIHGNMAAGGIRKILFMGPGQKKIAEIPLENNESKINIGAIIRNGGKKYVITNIRRVVRNIMASVEIATDNCKEPINISYNSIGVPTSFSVSNNALKILPNLLYHKIDIDEKTKKLIKHLAHNLGSEFNQEILYLVDNNERYVYYTFAGTFGNYLIACSQGKFEFYDEVKIILNKKIEPIEFDELFIKRIITRNLEKFAIITGKSDFFKFLPSNMQVEEIFSGIEPELITFLEKFHLYKFKEK